jgi:hypothetical protein
MELEMEAVEDVSLNGLAERLTAAAEALERAAANLTTVQAQAPRGTREADLERQLAEAQSALSALRAGGRKTIAAGTGLSAGTMVAKEGATVDFHGIDAALTSLSVEQRIAVKAGLMRSGLLG